MTHSREWLIVQYNKKQPRDTRVCRLFKRWLAPSRDIIEMTRREKNMLISALREFLPADGTEVDLESAYAAQLWQIKVILEMSFVCLSITSRRSSEGTEEAQLPSSATATSISVRRFVVILCRL